MAVLSINSSVAYGHVGNSAAVFCLQRLGLEVWPVNTVRFSNHPGYGSRRGAVADAEEVAGIIAGIGERGAFARCRAVLSGYLGTPEIGRRVVAAVAAVRAANGDALYCCDPVIGDVAEGLYVPREVAGVLATAAVPVADVVTPNAFELGWLAGVAVDDFAGALAAAEAVAALGPGVVIASSLPAPDGDSAAIATLARSAEGAWVVVTPRLETAAKGAGDALSALFLGHRLEGREVAEALAYAVSSVHGLIEAAAGTGARELPLIAAQEEITNPRKPFTARRIR